MLGAGPVTDKTARTGKSTPRSGEHSQTVTSVERSRILRLPTGRPNDLPLDEMLSSVRATMEMVLSHFRNRSEIDTYEGVINIPAKKRSVSRETPSAQNLEEFFC